MWLTQVKEEVVVHVSSRLMRRREIVAGIEAEPVSTSYSCAKTLLIGRADDR